MRTEGSAKRMTIATLIPRGAAVMDVSPADLARERTWRVQVEARATVAEERARAAEERARAAEERAVVSAWLIARLSGEMTGAEPWGDGAGHLTAHRSPRRRATWLWLQPAERRGEDRWPAL
jgi:hypothetical protein